MEHRSDLRLVGYLDNQTSKYRAVSDF
jgi:hypothetical protein